MIQLILTKSLKNYYEYIHSFSNDKSVSATTTTTATTKSFLRPLPQCLLAVKNLTLSNVL